MVEDETIIKTLCEKVVFESENDKLSNESVNSNLTTRRIAWYYLIQVNFFYIKNLVFLQNNIL